MKRIFLILAVMFSLAACSQNATWTGTKTFGSTLKFGSVIQNDTNTKILSIDATGRPGWIDKATIGGGSMPTLDQVLTSGNSAFNGQSLILGNSGANSPVIFESNIAFENSSNAGRLTVNQTGSVYFRQKKTQVDPGYLIFQNNDGYKVTTDWSTITANRAQKIEDRDGQITVARVEGTANLGIGEDALKLNTLGTYNLALGIASCQAFIGGSQNCAVGNYSMYTATSATGNTAVGGSALQNLTTGSYNTAVGYHTLESRVGSLTGSRNIGLGLQAGRAVTTGSNNILIENTTNDGISTGSWNIILDARNKSGVTTGNGNVIIGGYDGIFPAAMSETIVLGTGTGVQRLVIDSTGLVKLVSGAPVYADNVAAITGGLVVGNIYRTSTGQLMIVF